MNSNDKLLNNKYKIIEIINENRTTVIYKAFDVNNNNYVQ